MKYTSHSKLIPFIWSIADDCLRDVYVRGKHRDVILPMVMERQIIKADKKSSIVNDAIDYENETIGDPKYPLGLFQRVITVSVETMQIVNGLPKLEID